MVVKMKKWSPWQHHHQPAPAPAVLGSRRFRVKVERIRLEGFEQGGGGGEKVLGVELRWKGERRHGLAAVGFHRRRAAAEQRCKERVIRKGEVIVWEEDEDLENICWFSGDASSNAYGIDGYKFVPWILTFKFTYGEYNKGKMAVIGKASLNVAEFGSPVIEKKLPVDLEIAGLTTPATVSVLLSFVEIRDSGELVQATQSEDVNEDVKGKKKLSLEEVSLSDSDNSVTFDSDSTTESRAVTQSNSSVAISDDKKAGFFDWKRRRLNRKPAKTKAEDSRANMFSGDWVAEKAEYKNLIPNLWEAREFISRDGESKLDTSAFFASFDQCSDKAAGPSACTALVTVIAHWLGSHGSTVMPTVKQFDDLIVDGSAEWRNLCEKGTHVAEFPDRHFDLETVITAGIRPLSVSREKSFVGFFSPEKFESLSGVMSFDDIWDHEISRSPGVYIVSWNDHFFVLKAEEDGYYLIDTLGERLAEGCNQAYILRFDHGSCLTDSRNGRVICKGKECCKEFIKQFLAAIPLKELEMEEQKQAVPYYSLHHRLQIEFNFCSTV